MSSDSLFHKTAEFWIDTIQHGTVMFVIVSLFSLPAGFAIWGYIQWSFDYVLLAIVSVGAHLGAMYVRDIRRDEFDPEGNHEKDLIESLITIESFVIYFSTLIIFTTWLADSLMGKTSLAIIPVGFSLYYPLLDFMAYRRVGVSFGNIPVVLQFKILHSFNILKNMGHKSIIDDFFNNPVSRAVSTHKGMFAT